MSAKKFINKTVNNKFGQLLNMSITMVMPCSIFINNSKNKPITKIEIIELIISLNKLLNVNFFDIAFNFYKCSKECIP